MSAMAERIGYQEKINNLFGIYREGCPLRDDKLFLDFLPTGYELTTLSSVPARLMRTTIPAKLCLGMMITLYDDLADNPSFYNPKLLEELYKLPQQSPQSKNLVDINDLKIANLANILHENMFRHLKKLPNYFKYKEMFLFDLGNFYQANKLAEVYTKNPDFVSAEEMKKFFHHNMGMIMAGLIDLMASDLPEYGEMASIRKVLAYGQRAGRLCNILTTSDREKNEGDFTNEINVFNADPLELLSEFDQLIVKIRREAVQVKLFDSNAYADSINNLMKLHKNLQEFI